MVSQKYIYPSLFPEEELNENISSERKEYDLTNLFERLAKSDFLSRFHKEATMEDVSEFHHFIVGIEDFSLRPLRIWHLPHI